MKLRISDPLQLLPYQTGLIKLPLDKRKAEGDTANNLNVSQRSVQIGDPVPIVFGKFYDGGTATTTDDHGGVFVSPGATKARYEDGTSVGGTFYADALFLRICLVISQGQLGPIWITDVYQGACRRGTGFTYYGQLAGAYFTAGNAIDYTTVWDCPNYCGTDAGTYSDMTTFAYENKYLAGNPNWDKQIHIFIRNGIQVPRLIEGTTGSSNNMVDLALYLIRQTSRVPELLIDTTAMTLAANFVATNEFYWDGIINESSNLEDWMQQMAGFFLLRVSDKNGKKGFRPRLPINANYTINTGVISWVYGFTEEHLTPDGFEIEYIPLSERKSICAQMVWRQQPKNDVGFIRTTEVRITGEAVDGPYEQFDMSQFCTWEKHAVKVGAYEVARRKYVTHSLRIKVKPDSYNTSLALGDIVRVQLRRETEAGSVTYHDYLYEVEKINKTISGLVELDLMHFPIDSEGRSILALYVAGAQGTGYVYDLGRIEYGCDDPGNSGNETPLPTNVGENSPESPSTDVNLPAPATTGTPTDRPVIFGSVTPTGSATENNTDDPFDTSPTGTIGNLPTDRPLLPGDTLTYTPACEGGYTEWWLCPPAYVANNVGVLEENLAASCELIDEGLGSEYVVSLAAAGKNIVAIGRCPDPGSPDGYAQATGAATTPEVGGESGILYRPEPGYYSISWLGFYIATINSASAPNGIAIYASNKDESCSEGSARLWYSYINQNGALVDTLWNSGSGCVNAEGVLFFATVRFFFDAGGSVTLWTNGAPV